MLALLLIAPLCSGYVLPPAKVLQRWVTTRPAQPVTLPALLPVWVAGRPGHLYLERTGTHVAAVEGTRWVQDPGNEGRGGRVALWRTIELFLAGSAEAAAAGLAASGVDLSRGGYVRDASSGDGVAYTLGARGEGEGLLPQVWFARSPLGPTRLRLPDRGEVEIGPPGPDGWPSWLRFQDGLLLEIIGPAVPALIRPEWATAGDGVFALPPPDPLSEWRRAFGGSGQ